MKTFRPIILRFDSLASTNTEAARQAQLGAQEGLCIVAREQASGRGRQQRVWISPKDAGLYLSVVLKPRISVEKWPLITLMTALAVYDALLEVCALETDIKWPNDIYASGKKLCGILAETIETDTERAVIVGIGVNLSERAFPDELSEVATSVERETGNRVIVESLLQSLLASLQKRYSVLQSDVGARQTLDEWKKRSSYAEGMRVSVNTGEEIFRGTTRGLASDGALRVETDAGVIRTIHAGEITSIREEKTK
ncbi:MAG: biotin--[acetyl-CoA-carboxylase] ligase [Acidobacteria bacterium 13_1_20CM_3_53_8]|nr:MAG: biotin--[acetyl-CoA-carboxylase] ligase [Acidobacteria bacterium 13_1_20CM_3_53_8]